MLRLKLMPRLLLLLSLAWPSAVESAQILGLFGHPGKSHFDFFRPLFVALAERGHNVSMYSYFPLKEPLANYTDYVFEGMPLLTDFVDLKVNVLQVSLPGNSSLSSGRTLNNNQIHWAYPSKWATSSCCTTGACAPARWHCTRH